MKKILLFFALLSALTTNAEVIDGINYNLNYDARQASVTSGDGYSGSITIPETVTYNDVTFSVTSIEGWAFQYCDGLTSVTIPNSVTSIGDGAFDGCSGLTSIDVPNNVTSIGDGTFNNCSSLTSVTIGDGVTSIGSEAFNGCSALETVTISNSVISIGWRAFFNCQNLTSVILGNSVTSIENGAFSDCKSLTSVTIPNSVTSIGEDAFHDCSSLTSVTIGNSVKSIGSGAFGGCSSLTSINIPDGVTSIGGDAFWGCSKLTSSINIPDGVKSIEYRTFADCSSLTSITIGKNVKAIGEAAFHGCSSLISIDIPNNVTSIGNYAFEGCSSLTSINIPDGVTSIGNGTFSGCASLASVTIGNNVTSIGDGAFSSCSGLTSIEIPSSVTKIGSSAFSGCSGLTSIDIPEGVTSIENYIFEGCASLASVTIGNSVTSIGYSAFSGCHSLTSINIPDGVTSIGGAAFYNCGGLTSIDIPEGVTSIENYIFLGCHRLASVTIPDGVTSIGEGSFSQCPLTSIIIPSGVTSIGYSAFSGCHSLTSINIPDGVTSIGREAFQGCWNLKEVYISDLAAWCNISFAGNNVFDGVEGFVLNLNGTPLQGQIIIPDGITKVRANSFQKVKDVYSFVIPSTVQTIENNAFNPNYLMEVIINTENVISLASASVFTGKTAIYVNDELISDYRVANQWSDIKDQIYVKGCRQLTVELEAAPNSPALLTALTAWEQENSEYKIARLAGLKIKGTMNGWDILMIRNKMPNLHNLDLGEATILDNDGGMEYYQGYHTIAGTISPYTFYELDNLKTVILPNDITSIEDNAFASSGLQNISIPGTVKEIKSNAFSSCSALSTIKLNKGLETIGYQAFYRCINLKEFVFPSTLKKIGYCAIEGCSNLTDIEFAEGLEEIDGKAFYECSKLNNLHLPTSLTRIGEHAFHGCSGLSEVHLPSMITWIGDNAFTNCGLESVYAYTVVPIQINQNTFDYDGVDLYAPANSFYAYYLNTQWSQFLDVKEFDALYTNWYMPKNTDLEIDTDKPITSEDEDKASDGEMEAGSGMIITGDGEQQVDELVMECEEGEGYPTVIENDNLSVEKLTFKIDVRPGRWYFFSFPFDVNMSDIKHEGKWVWRYYDSETRAAQGVGGWKNTVGDVLKANQGYIFQCNKAGVLEISVTKPEFDGSEEKDIALEYIEAKNAQDASWNFVGNPNLSYYSLDDMAETFDAPITVWNDEQQTYTAVIPGDDDYNFHPFEAYFVQTPADVDKMTFENENRATYLQSEKKSNQARRMTRSGQSVNEKRMLINLTVSDGQTTDKTRVIFNDDNKMTYETGRDANKFMSMANVPQIYTIDAQNVKYSINARPNGNRQVRVGYVASSDGNYTIAAERMDCSMALKDNQTGTIHQLDEKPYTFYSEAGTFDNRFTLMSGMNITSISANGLEGIDGFNVAAMDGGIIVTGACEGNVNVYNANGVKAATLKGSGTINLNNGTYIVTYAGKSTKIVIK